MPIPIDAHLYTLAKEIADKTYDRPSAYKSGFIVKLYKDLGGRYVGNRKTSNLKRWFDENWADVNPYKTDTSYPVYRPTKRISKDTPLTVAEIDKEDLKKKAILKQYITSRKLKPFKPK